jgi:nucleoside-diphosphate-sugar epimerase
VYLLPGSADVVLPGLKNVGQLKTISILGCGWLGKAAAAHLLESDYQIKGSTTSESKLADLQHLGIEPYLIKLDPSPGGDTVGAFFSTDTLIVAIPPKRKSNATDVYLEQMRELNIRLKTTPVQSVIFISSTAVYADEARIVTEADVDPTSYLYHAERLFLENSSINTTILRLGGLIGSDRHPGKFLAGKSDVAGRNHPVNLIHQVDCVKIIGYIVQKQIWNQVFNACCDVHTTREQFYSSAAKNLKLVPPVFKNDPSVSKTVNSEKLKSVLGFQFSNALVESYMKH